MVYIFTQTFYLIHLWLTFVFIYFQLLGNWFIFEFVFLHLCHLFRMAKVGCWAFTRSLTSSISPPRRLTTTSRWETETNVFFRKAYIFNIMTYDLRLTTTLRWELKHFFEDIVKINVRHDEIVTCLWKMEGIYLQNCELL